MTGKFDFAETDRRILEQKIRKHQLSPLEYQKMLKNLPDERERVEEQPVSQEIDNKFIRVEWERTLPSKRSG